MATANTEKYAKIAADVSKLQEIIKSRRAKSAESTVNLANEINTNLSAVYEEDGNTDWASQEIVTSGIVKIVDVYLDVYEWRCQQEAKQDEGGTNIDIALITLQYYSVLSCMAAGTDKYTSFCECATEKNVIEVLIKELEKPEMLKRSCSSFNEVYDQLILQLIIILANITGRTSNAVARFNKKSIDIVKKFCDGNDYGLMMMALFTVSYVALDKEKISIKSELAEYITRLLRAALHGNYRDFNFSTTATELLDSLCQVANFSDNCVSKLVDAGILDVLDAILIAPSPQNDTKVDRLMHERPSDPNVIVVVTSDTEKLLTVKFCWMAKFTKKVQKILVARESTVKALQHVAQTASNTEVGIEAKNLLASMFTELPKKPHPPELKGALSANDKGPESARLLEKRKQLDKNNLQKVQQSSENDCHNELLPSEARDSKRGDRIFVSYSHKQQKLVFSLVDKLRAAGFKNVVTDQTIAGDWYTWMVEQVELADIVLVCFSKAYYESGNCKDEAMNARALGKVIIPCKMEDYTPISWLGGITRVRLFRDYWHPSRFDDSVSKLINELNDNMATPSKADENIIKQNSANLKSTHSHASNAATDNNTEAQSSTVKSSQLNADQLANVNYWDEQKTKQWLSSIGYPDAAVQNGALNGKFVSTLIRLARKNEKFLLQILLRYKGVSLDQAIQIVGELAAGPK